MARSWMWDEIRPKIGRVELPKKGFDNWVRWVIKKLQSENVRQWSWNETLSLRNVSVSN